MKWLLITLVILAGCSSVICNEPYMRYEAGCCLDTENNKICDKDEIEVSENTPTQAKEIVQKFEEETIKVESPKNEVPFEVELVSVKDSIRKVDQALFNLVVRNNADSRKTYRVTMLDDWRLLSSPFMSPIHVVVAAHGKNHVRIMLQPPRGISEGEHLVMLSVSSDEEVTVEAKVTVG